ncbi:MAG: hypothetical protein E6G56_11290 [Actinobacteria bacterium]|nr:MAG: hypothetical protein E6G56_11290 [Actinomycetota bacterium]
MTEDKQDSAAARADAKAREVADRGEADVDQLERHTERLGHEIDAARRDWEAKQADPSIPGAVSPEPSRKEEPSSPERGQAADEPTAPREQGSR